ncbi:MAG: hypothetical protein LUH21_03020 [Clostridiales bacterium]|nr:hypothetical protein [Clostridiales bacterium]
MRKERKNHMMICTGCKLKNKRGDSICEICGALKKVRELEQFQEEWRMRLQAEDGQKTAVRGLV